MRFLPTTSRRAIAEALLAVAIVAFVVYDLGDHPAKPSSQNVVLSFEGKGKPAASASTSSPRFDSTVSTSIVPPNLFFVCGNTPTLSNLWLIGNGTNQALIIYLGGSCPPQPNITYTDPTTNVTIFTPITVNPGSYLSFQNVTSTNVLPSGATAGALVMFPGSILETIFALNLGKLPKTVSVYNLMVSTAPCPSFTGVSFPILNCPNDPSLAMVGYYSCAVSAAALASGPTGSSTWCLIFASVVGALTQSSPPITIQLSTDCTAFTIAMFKAEIFGLTGIPVAAINILSVACGSVTVVFTILGSDPALIAAAVALLMQIAMMIPGVIFIGYGVGVPASYYPLVYCYYYGSNYCGSTTTFSVSSSNPALFALLTLLVIPVAIILSLLVRCCMQKQPCCVALPVCPPAPVCPAAPVVYYPEPTCVVPCPDPCAGAAAYQPVM